MEIKKNFGKSAIAAIMILLALLIVSPQIRVKAFPNDKPAIMVEPAAILNSTLTPGSTFAINISLYNVTHSNVPAGLAGIEVHLTWNNATIQPLSYTDKTGVSGGVLVAPVIYGLGPGFFDASDNQIYIAPYVNAISYEVGAASRGGAWWGNGLVATISFIVVGVGTTGLNLTLVKLDDANVQLVSFYSQNGSFDNRGAPSASVYVSPSSIINSGLGPGSSFSTNVSIASATNLAYFAFSLSFNYSVIQAANAVWSNGSGLGIQIDNSTGVVSGSTSIAPPKTGSATLVTVAFNVTSLGQSNLHLYGLTLLDNTSSPLSFTSADGYFNNMYLTTIYVDPALIMNPALYPGVMTQFGIVAINFPNVYTCQFNLTFNPAVIKILGYALNPTDSSTVDSSITTNNTLGLMRMSLTYNPALSFSKATLFNITYLIVGYGMTYLNLTASLADPSSNVIPCQTQNAFLDVIIRDVAVVDIQPSPQKVYPGRNITVSVTVANLGSLLAETFNVSVFVDSSVYLGMASITSLNAGANATFTFNWNTAGQTIGSWHPFSANATFVPYEYNTTNNFLVGPVQARIKMPGDIDGDGTVGLSDLVILAKAYNAKVGNPLYNIEADIDLSGQVDLADLVTLAINYGKSY